MTIILPFLSAALLALPTLTLADLFDDAVSQAVGWNANLTWTPCPEHPENTKITCSNFTIPLDWADSSVGNGSLALARYSANNETKLGTIFTNPGGPGLTGRAYIFGFGERYANQSSNMYDIISWDPRGVGKLTFPGRAGCFETEGDYETFFNGTAISPIFDYTGNFTDQAEIDAYYALAEPTEEAFKALPEVCADVPSGQHLQYVGTVATVRDIMAMNEFFQGKDTDVNFWGFSYGTIIGTTLVNMFPDRVGRVIIDGVSDPLYYWVDRTDLSYADSISDMDAAFRAFNDECLEAGPEVCAIADQSIRANLDIVEWTQNLTDWAHDLADLGYIIRSTAWQAMYDPANWGTFANTALLPAWQAAVNGSGDIFPPADPSTPRTSSADPQFAIEAGDSKDPASDLHAIDVFAELVRVSQDVSGLFGLSTIQARHAALMWPFRAVERFEGPFDSTLKNTIIIATNTIDPVTPKKNAQKVADLLGDSAQLVEQRGYGHTTLAEHSECIDLIYQAYWVNGSIPTGDDAICDVDASSVHFATATAENQ